MILAALALLATPKEIVLPIEYVNGRVYVPVQVNGRSSSFVFDTGAGMSCLDTDFAKSVGAKLTKPIDADGNGGTVRASLIENASCKVGSETQPFQVAIPLKSLSSLEGRNFEGLLGTDFIGRFVVAVDYEQNRIVLNPTGRFDGDVLPCQFEAMRPVVTTQVAIGGKTYSVRTLVDTGASNALYLTSPFVAKHPELNNLAGSKPNLASGGVGGMSMGRFVRGDELRIGTQVLRKPVVQLYLSKEGLSGKSAGYDAMIGGETLRRFTLVTDYANKKLTFAPNSSIDTPFVADSSGLSVVCKGKDLRRFVVRYVEPDSPASQANLRAGDEITAVDDRPARSLTLHEIRDALLRPGTTVRLTTTRGVVSLSLREPY